MRHTQTEVHTLSNYNKYYSGFHNYLEQHDRVWYLSVPKSFFDDALSAGPFEFLIAIGFSFEYLLTNLLFVPFMSGASFNGDLPTMTFGFSAQSDESRHMTLGLEAIKFLLEQDEANVPIVQAWIDKWFWRGYRVTGLVAQMLDYMLPAQGDELEGGLRALLRAADDAGPVPGPRLLRHPPAQARRGRHRGEGDPLAPGLLDPLPVLARRRVHDERPGRRAPGVALEDLPGHLRHVLPPLWDKEKRNIEAGGRHFVRGLPQLCQVCQIPMGFTEPGDPTTICQRDSRVQRARSSRPARTGASGSSSASRRSTSRPGCPCHQIYQGNCGGPTVPDVLQWYGLQDGDNGEYKGSRRRPQLEEVARRDRRQRARIGATNTTA